MLIKRREVQRLQKQQQKQMLNETAASCLLMYESEIDKTRQKTRDYIKTIEVDRKDGWWTTQRKLESGEIVYPFESVENDLFHFYFSEYYNNNTFEPGIARIAIDELDFDLSMDFCKEFMMLKKILKIIMDYEDEYLKYDENLNGLSYYDLYDKYKNSIAMDYASMEKRIWNRSYTRNEAYTIIRIKDYEHSKYFYQFTPKMSRWCMTYDKYKFDGYTQNGKFAMYYVVVDDYENIVQPTYEYINEQVINSEDAVPADWVDYADVNDDRCAYLPYDEYGLSMMFVVVDDEGKLNCCASRWNHELGEYARDFLDEERLSKVLGVNFYETFLPVSGEVKRPEEVLLSTKELDESEDFISEDEEERKYLQSSHLKYDNCYIWTLGNYQKGDKIFLLTEYDFNTEETRLLHCGLYIDHKFVDCTGVKNSLEEVLYDFEYGDYNEYILTLEQFKNALRELNIAI